MLRQPLSTNRCKKITEENKNFILSSERERRAINVFLRGGLVAWPFHDFVFVIDLIAWKAMSAKRFLSIVFVSLVVIQCSARREDRENPFRMSKLNMIWQKAQKKMSERKLSEFRRLLELQDRAEIKWKDLKASGGDEDGEMEAMLRRKFSRVLEQFGLDTYVKEEGNDNTAGHGIYADKRLDELWESAKTQG